MDQAEVKGLMDYTLPQSLQGVSGSGGSGDGHNYGEGESSNHAGPSSPPSHSKRRRRDSSSEPTRVTLACFYCRSKRIRCNGIKPTCEGCQKANVPCEWPTSRAKKRTKKQMEEARMRAKISGEGVINDDNMSLADTNLTTNLSADPNELWTLTSSTNYLWPTDFIQNDTLNTNDNSNPLSMGLSDFSPSISIGDLGSMSTGENTMINAMLSSGGSLTNSTGRNLSDVGMLGIPTDWSPSADLRLASALEDQMAFINGNPEEDKDLELYYYRFSGSTAIHPGVNRISLKLQRRSANSPLAAPQPGETESPSSFITPSADLFDHTGMPHPEVWRPLFALFLKHCSQHFPSTSHKRMVERIETGTMSQFLACCICSLGARFSGEGKDPSLSAAPFIAKAQELIIPLLHLPTYDVVTGLLFLAWGNYGQNSESGLWQYSGMAFRMAIDLGIHEVSELYESPAHLIRTRLLFWSLFITDRIVAFATGRPASIPEDIIEIPLPIDEDFFPDPSRNLPESKEEEIEPIPFVQLVKLMIICGRISNVLNGRRGRSRTLVNSTEPLPELLADLQLRLVQFYSNLPESLKWSAENFKHQHLRGHSGTFLTLHLWANAVLALIYHPDLLKSPSGIETPLNKSMDRNVKLSLASSRQICECMVFADLVDSTSYTSAPYLTQPLFVGAMAFIHEMRSLTISSSNPSSQSNATDILMLSMAKQNFQALLNAIQKMEDCWAGAGYVAQILERRSGFPKSTKRRSNKKTFISLPDTGLLRRFTTDRNHPSDIAPPTETSMRESIARSERSTSFSASGPTPLWLADLMSGYTVQNMSFAPADTLDLQRLLASGSGYGISTDNIGGNVQGNGPSSDNGFGMLRGDGNESTPGSGHRV
uniref:Pathway-specific nitrogen regulator n=1 Tax=Kwoniella pini CBS 10737 TaxID=1296096 RepID=A0A1B9HTT8_9TREE|nr:pathway-specific nitrogen regulator [Kwoniella pini CBS 10737]OCF46684.1 pathway-specific nitrogen regulator [Kwoniella pini CBS 10737]